MKRLAFSVSYLCLAFAGGGFVQGIENGLLKKAFADIVNTFRAEGGLTFSSNSDNAEVFASKEDIEAKGVSEDPIQGFNRWKVRDRVDAGSNLLSSLYIRNQYGGDQSAGDRFNLFSYFSVDQTPSKDDNSQQNYTAATMQAYANTAAVAGLKGGQGYGRGQYAGSLWGMDTNVWLGREAKSWQYLAGNEIGVAIYNGASVADRWGLPIYASGDVAAAMDDAGILIAGAGSSASANFKTGIEFGGLRHNWGIQENGTLIGTVKRTFGGESEQRAAIGIDFSSVRFSSAPIIMPQITPTATTRCRVGSIEWDSNYIYICDSSNYFKRAALSRLD